jgi:hypothetical protein
MLVTVDFETPSKRTIVVTGTPSRAATNANSWPSCAESHRRRSAFCRTEAAQGGNAETYAQLLGELAPRLRWFVRGHWRLLGAEDVEDLVQEVLLSVHAVRATYDPGARSCRGFLPSCGTGSPMAPAVMHGTKAASCILKTGT